MKRVWDIGAKGGESEGFIATGRQSTVGVSLGAGEIHGPGGVWMLLMMQVMKM